VTDLASNSYDRYFEIINIIPSQTKGEGTLLTLDCLGIEYHTQQINMSKPIWFEDSFTTAYAVGENYEMSRGTEQPILTEYDTVYTTGFLKGNALPFYNSNNWEFGISEDTCYNRWMDLIDGAGAAVSAGGALTFYELNFKTTGVNSMDFNLRPSGDNTSIVSIITALTIGVSHADIGKQEGELSNPTGTNVLSWGSNDHGTLPVDNSKYYSKFTQFLLRPEWINGVVYAVDVRVKVTPTTTISPKHYKCILAHTASDGVNDPSTDVSTYGTPGTFWEQVDMGDEFGDSIQYSPWTDNNARLWSNAGADPARNQGYTQGGWFDINVVINEDDWFRTWVDAIATSDATLDTLASEYAYDGTRATFPRGFRVLVNGSGSGDLNNFDNMVVERVETGENTRSAASSWSRLYTFSTSNDKVEVAVLDEAKIYHDTITGTPNSPSHSWASIETGKYGNDCFHPYTTVPTNVSGIDRVNDVAAATRVPRSEVTDSTNRPDISGGGGTFSTNQNSAISFVCQAANIISSTVSSFSTQTGDWYKNALGFNIRFPFPNNDSGHAQVIGGLYGGGDTLGNWATSTAYSIGATVNQSGDLYICLIAHTSGTFATDLTALKWRLLVGQEPATLDIQNMNFTHDGQNGFNALNDSSEDLGQISAIAMWLNIYTNHLIDLL